MQSREESKSPVARPARLGIDWQVAGYGTLIGALSAMLSAFLLNAPAEAGALAVLVGAAAGGVLGFLLARSLKRDLTRIGIYAALLARGQYQAAEVLETGTGEVRFLARQLRQMAKTWAGQVDALQRLADDRARLAERTEKLAVLEERQRLARELHDTVSQELFGLAMLVAATRSLVKESDTDVRARLHQAEEGARRAQATMRGLIRALRPVELGDKPLSAALQTLLADVRERQGIKTVLTVTGERAIPPGVEDALFRVAQEAVSNAVRHAHPTHIMVMLAAEEDGVSLSVEDDGIGFKTDAVQDHVGFSTMRERTAEIGARLAIRGQPGHGALVSVRAPLAGGDGEGGRERDDASTRPLKGTEL